MDIEHSATYEALPAHVKPTWLRGWALFEGFAVVQGRVWNDQTPRWQFLCKQHGTKTANKRGLEARKGKDEEGNVVTDRQRRPGARRKTTAGRMPRA